MTTLAPGEIILVRFPFSDLETAKKRPALVLAVTSTARRNALVTIAMITSKVDGLELPGDVLLKDWEKARLLHPSLIRLSKVATLDDTLIERKIGALAIRDQSEVRSAFRKIFKVWL